ncbi:hypothetical protein GCM10023231_12920 [Olivibacter ginsenosidimutans]|uniref:Cyclic nucleotide-binding domain-containing protein n=1 Tax=Olivibacter ginsenosidimutans TaxID=1176537 RepID=A0ABP9AV42_9SPHI
MKNFIRKLKRSQQCLSTATKSTAKASTDSKVEIVNEFLEFEEILKFFETKQVSKKENLLEEGQTCRYHYFVLNGLLRKFFINEKGIEQTTEFAVETWWLTDNIAYEHKLPTEFYIQALEKSQILYISQDNQEKLLKAFPKMERYFRFVYQRAYAAAQNPRKALFTIW